MNKLEKALAKIAGNSERGYKTTAARVLGVRSQHVTRWIGGGYISEETIDKIAALAGYGMKDFDDLLAWRRSNGIKRRKAARLLKELGDVAGNGVNRS